MSTATDECTWSNASCYREWDGVRLWRAPNFFYPNEPDLIFYMNDWIDVVVSKWWRVKLAVAPAYPEESMGSIEAILLAPIVVGALLSFR